jgi:hypothetical protein
MVHVIPSLRPTVLPVRTTPTKTRPSTTTSTPATSTTATDPTLAAPDFRALFSGKTYPAVDPPPQNPAPTAESVFGSSPWITNPTGLGPGGVYSYNPFYFATPQTAATVAQMVGGTVVSSNTFTPNGGPFAQQQPNWMVQLPDGRMINPGLVASFYTHGYPQSYIDQMIASEVKNA